MIDQLLSWTSLPNLHPALVHFPIAFTLLALVFDLAAVSRSERSWLDRAAAATWVAAGLGAGAAFWAGRLAADSLLVAPRLQARINTHADWGLYTVWTVGVLAALRLGFALWDSRRSETRGRRPALIVFVLAGLAAVGVVGRTADLGGGLVFRHGVAVLAADTADGTGGEGAVDAPADAAGAEAGGDAASRLRESADGTVTWTPSPSDASALGSILAAAPGSSLDAVSAGAGTGAAGAGTGAAGGASGAANGLALAVDGRALLVLPGSFGDVQVEATLDLSGFEGTAGLAHHVRGAGDAGLFTIEAPAGRWALTTLEDGALRTLGKASREVPAGPVELTVSAIGRHLRGLAGGELVAHGHEPALPDGRCGLLLDGAGTVRVVSLRIVPAAP